MAKIEIATYNVNIKDLLQCYGFPCLLVQDFQKLLAAEKQSISRQQKMLR